MRGRSTSTAGSGSTVSSASRQRRARASTFQAGSRSPSGRFTSGLVLYAFGITELLAILLALHLGSVFAFFVLMPHSKMAHRVYHLAALVRGAQVRLPRFNVPDPLDLADRGPCSS